MLNGCYTVLWLAETLVFWIKIFWDGTLYHWMSGSWWFDDLKKCDSCIFRVWQLFLVDLLLDCCSWRHCYSVKHQELLDQPHNITSQKAWDPSSTAVRTCSLGAYLLHPVFLFMVNLLMLNKSVSVMLDSKMQVYGKMHVWLVLW
jgi:hypothetical protein